VKPKKKKKTLTKAYNKSIKNKWLLIIFRPMLVELLFIQDI
jgi:hypothetical protein